MSEISKINYIGTDYDIAGNSGTGWTPQAVSLLHTILTNAVYCSDQSSNISALIEQLSSSGGIDVVFSNHVLALSGFASTPTITIT